MFGKKDSVDKGLPFGLTRFLSWISLILILASSVMLAFFIGNSARNTLLLRQQQYAMLMASNLNQQIYRRFTLPTFLAFGRIALRQSMQYQQLDDVVQSTISACIWNPCASMGPTGSSTTPSIRWNWAGPTSRPRRWNAS